MAGTVQISGDVLKWARSSMGYTIEEAAKKADVTPDQLRSWEEGVLNPTYKQLEKLAEKAFKRSLALLLMQKVPSETPVQQDFRNITNAEKNDLSPDMRLVLRKARRYQRVLEEVASGDDESTLWSFKVSTYDDPASAAAKFRKLLGLTLKEQKSWPYESSLNEFKKRVESLGVYVFQLKMSFEEARAFCLTGKFPLIVLNKEDSSNGRIFSLFHELCHLMFNVNGIFRDSETGNLSQEYKKIENFCNRFAADFLVPESDLDAELAHHHFQHNHAEAFITRLARQYNVSSEVIARKFLARQLITSSQFWTLKRLWDAVARAAKKKKTDEMNQKEDGGGIPQDTKIIFEKGRLYLEKVITAYRSGRIDSADYLNYLETKLVHAEKIANRLNI